MVALDFCSGLLAGFSSGDSNFSGAVPIVFAQQPKALKGLRLLLGWFVCWGQQTIAGDPLSIGHATIITGKPMVEMTKTSVMSNADRVLFD